MMTCWVFSGVLVVVAVSLCDGSDYCSHEEFSPSCLDNQVIVAETGKYGRMEKGRCIKTNFGFLGCSVDVLEDIHVRCSGRRHCLIRVPDPAFDEFNPCHEDLTNYLTVTYQCINVTLPEHETCWPNSTANTSVSGYLASVVTQETGCGDESSPWQLLALPGQRFNITLMDFRRKTLYTRQRVAAPARDGILTAEQILCKELAVVLEDDIRTPLSSCDGTGVMDPGGTRYTSMGHNVTVYLRSRAITDLAQFIIKYDVVGCPDVPADKLMWVTRDGEKMSVGCRYSDLTWHMTCIGTEWHGETGNCSAGEMTDARKHREGSSVIIILVVSGVVGVLVLIVGLFCMKRYRARRGLRPDLPMKDIRPLNQDDGYEQDVLYARNNAFMPVRLSKQKLGKRSASADDDHDYEYVWDMSGVAKSGVGPGGNTIQTSACVVTARNTSPRAAHTVPDDCRCPEIHVHVHHSTENADGTQAQVSRVHIKTRADTMPRIVTSTRTPTSNRRDGSDATRTPATLRAIQPPPETPGRSRKAEGASSHKHICTTGRRKPTDSPHSQHRPSHSCSKADSDGSNKRYWTLPVKSAFKAKQQQKLPSPKDSTG